MFNNKRKTENPVFENKWKEYKENVELLKNLEKTFNEHLETTRDYVRSCNKLALQIGAFFKGSEEKVSKRTTQFAQVNSRVEFHSFKAIEKLYKEQILQPMKVLWVMDAENRRAIKERKRLLTNQNKKYKAWAKKVAEKEGIEKQLKLERQNGKEKKTFLGKKRKSITEVNKEVLDKLRAFEEAEKKQKELTLLTEKKLDSLMNSKKTGELLSSAVAGLLACQLELSSATREEINGVKANFKEAEVFKRTLRKYTVAASRGHNLDEEPNPKQGFVFGRMLTTSTPDIVCDCINYIKAGIGAEGLFRIPGNRMNVEIIQASYDKNEKHILNSREDFEIHDVCSALKFYFNTLPEPLIPYTIYEDLEKFFADENRVGGIYDEHNIIDIVGRMPQPYKGLLGMLLNFLFDVTRHQGTNHMTATNLATCFAPVLLKPRPDPKNKDSTIESLRSMKNIAANIATVSVLIENARSFKLPAQEEIAQHTNISPDTIRRVKRTYRVNNSKAVPPKIPPMKKAQKPANSPAMPSRPNRKGIEVNVEELNKLQEQQNSGDILQSPERKNRGFIRRQSLENESALQGRPLPTVGGAPPGLSNSKPTPGPEPPKKEEKEVEDIPVEEIPAALLGEPGSLPTPPVAEKKSSSIDKDL